MKDELKLIRERLGAIDLSDIEDRDMTPQERRDYCAALFAVFPRLEKDIRRFIFHQVLFIAKEAGSYEHVTFGRGVVEGLAMALDHWKLASDEHINNSRGESFDKFAPISEI